MSQKSGHKDLHATAVQSSQTPGEERRAEPGAVTHAKHIFQFSQQIAII